MCVEMMGGGFKDVRRREGHYIRVEGEHLIGVCHFRSRSRRRHRRAGVSQGSHEAPVRSEAQIPGPRLFRFWRTRGLGPSGEVRFNLALHPPKHPHRRKRPE